MKKRIDNCNTADKVIHVFLFMTLIFAVGIFLQEPKDISSNVIGRGAVIPTTSTRGDILPTEVVTKTTPTGIKQSTTETFPVSEEAQKPTIETIPISEQKPTTLTTPINEQKPFAWIAPISDFFQTKIVTPISDLIEKMGTVFKKEKIVEIGEVKYDEHALDRMEKRKLTPTVIKDTIEHGTPYDLIGTVKFGEAKGATKAHIKEETADIASGSGGIGERIITVEPVKEREFKNIIVMTNDKGVVKTAFVRTDKEAESFI